MDILGALGILGGVVPMVTLAWLALSLRKRNLRRRFHAKDMQRADMFRKDREEFQLQARKYQNTSRKRHGRGGSKAEHASDL